MDFNVDDNGLWVIYATADSNNTHVAKVSTSLAYQYLIGIQFGVESYLLYLDHRIIVQTFDKTSSKLFVLKIYQHFFRLFQFS